MAFGNEKLDVDRAAIESVGWADRYCETLKGHPHAKDQRLRASQAIALNITEGNGKATNGERRISAGLLKSREVRRLSALRFRTCCTWARPCPQTTTHIRRPGSIAVWPC
jgi:hypothetical protein